MSQYHSTRDMPWGYKWRSTKWLLISTMTIALFAETFLFGFQVPILNHMLEERLHIDPSRTQPLASDLYSIHGFCGLISAPIIAHFADKSPDRKRPLLIALAGCFTGTLLIALTPSLAAVFIGRILQAVSGAAAWLIGFAVISDSIGTKDLGKTMGFAMSFVTMGTLGGPMVGGTAYQLFGYWPAWSIPLAILIIDIGGRLIMIEPNDNQVSAPTPDSANATETTSLLPEPSPDNTQNVKGETGTSQSSAFMFYRIMLREPRVLFGLANVLMSSWLPATFNSTLPTHLRQAFGWKSSSIGMIFACLSIPSLLLGGPFGCLRDRYGLRIPNLVGWASLSPFLLISSMGGNAHFPWASEEKYGEPVFICCMLGIGISLVLVRGAGAVQLTYVVKELQAKDPFVFGGQSGSSRVYSMTEVAYSLGLTLGPLISGTLFDKSGFFASNVLLSIICLLMASVSIVCLGERSQASASGPDV